MASLLATNLLSLAAIVLLHRLAMLRAGQAAADATVLLAMSFPSAFFMCLPYSESPFLLLAIGLLLAMQTDRPVWTWLLGAASVDQGGGIICLCPIVVDQILKRRPGRALILASGPLAGVAAYFVVFKIMTGDAMAGLHASAYVTVASPSNLLHPIRFLELFFGPGIQLHGYFNSAIDRGIFILFLASLWPMAKRSLVDVAYSLPMGIIPAMSMLMMAYTRYALAVFPMFIVGGELLSLPRRRWWLWTICAAGFSLQLLLLLRHSRFLWVA